MKASRLDRELLPSRIYKQIAAARPEALPNKVGFYPSHIYQRIVAGRPKVLTNKVGFYPSRIYRQTAAVF